MDSFLETFERENKIVWDRVDALELEQKRLNERIKQLENALKEILSLGSWGANDLARTVAREALEATNDPLDEEKKR
jgi:hypothetical protein